MSRLPILTPTGQNWSCHSCAGCCSEHLIEITAEERQRILDQQWTPETGVIGDPVVTIGRGSAGLRYRLAHQPDGRCVFLDDRGLCRIHGKFGEPAKPLACRVYPYALHPHGKSVAVSLRFSCPSVVANRGRAVSEQLGDLQLLAREIVPVGADRIPPPSISAQSTVEWPVFDLLIERLEWILTNPTVDWRLRVFRTLAWAHLLGPTQLQSLTLPQAREFLDLLTAAVLKQCAQLPEPIDPPSRIGRLYFRLMAAQYARKDTVGRVAQGWKYRWQLLRAVLAFTRGVGQVPPLQTGFAAVPFADLELPQGGLPEGSDELLSRYLRIKVQGLHFCGPAFYGFSFVEGLQGLLLILPLVCWMARWKAKSEQRDTWELADLQHALAVVDHHHGYAQFPQQRSNRTRVRYLAESGELTRLCVWYAR